MASDLDEIKTRLDYCEEEVAQLESGIKRFFDASLQIRQFPVGAHAEIKARILSPVPQAIKYRTGSTINEIRASLDALACCLAMRNGQDTKAVYFPISRSLEAFQSDGMRKIRKLSAADQAAIAAFKPYKEARPLLSGMHDFDCVRKHQRIGMSVPNSGGVTFGDGVLTFINVRAIDVLDHNWRTLVTMGSGTSIQLTFHADMVFAEPPEINGVTIVKGIRQFLSEAREVVKLFDKG